MKGYPSLRTGWSKQKTLEEIAIPPAVPAVLMAWPSSVAGLGDALCKHLKTMGLSHSTSIQAAAIPGILSGEDLVIGAETGSGKTLAYLLPIVERLLRGLAVSEELPDELLGQHRRPLTKFAFYMSCEIRHRPFFLPALQVYGVGRPRDNAGYNMLLVVIVSWIEIHGRFVARLFLQR